MSHYFRFVLGMVFVLVLFSPAVAAPQYEVTNLTELLLASSPELEAVRPSYLGDAGQIGGSCQFTNGGEGIFYREANGQMHLLSFPDYDPNYLSWDFNEHGQAVGVVSDLYDFSSGSGLTLGPRPFLWDAMSGNFELLFPTVSEFFWSIKINDQGQIAAKSSSSGVGASFDIYFGDTSAGFDVIPCEYYFGSLNNCGQMLIDQSVWSVDNGFSEINTPENIVNLVPITMNDWGEITGWCGIEGEAEPYAFLWSEENGFSLLSKPDFSKVALGLDVNDLGEVVGRFMNDSDVATAAYWSSINAEGIDLNTIVDYEYSLVDVLAINNQGAILAWTESVEGSATDGFCVLLTPVPEPGGLVMLATLFGLFTVYRVYGKGIKQMSRYFRFVSGTVLVLGLFSPALAAPQYEVTNLTELLLASSPELEAVRPSYLGDAGQIGGTCQFTSGGEGLFYREADGQIYLSTLMSSSIDFNENGQVVGIFYGFYNQSPVTQRPFLWDTKSGSIEFLFPSVSEGFWEIEINDQGQIAASVDSAGTETSRDLCFWDADTGFSRVPCDDFLAGINNQGQVLLQSSIWSLEEGFSDLHRPENMKSLVFSKINDSGEVIGWCSLTDEINEYEENPACFWSEDTGFCFLQQPDSVVVSLGMGINDLGQIVGSFFETYNTATAAYWPSVDSEYMDLNTLIDCEYTLERASMINNQGTILAWTKPLDPSDTLGLCMLLTPVPEPGVFVMLLGAIVAVVLFRWI